MRRTLINLALAALLLAQAGCAVGFRAGGKHGVGGGASVGPAPAIVAPAQEPVPNTLPPSPY